MTILDVDTIRQAFPFFQDKSCIYLDNAATTQKPKMVLDCMHEFQSFKNANVHRGVYALSDLATSAYENARSNIASYLGANSPSELVFVKGTTEGINLIAQTFGKKHVNAGDEIIISAMEHHANMVPWQILAQEKEACIKVIPLLENGELDLEAFEKLLSPKVRRIALTHASNVLGTINPISKICKMAKLYNAAVVIDGAQGFAHMPINVQEMGCHFYVFSGHKCFGPTGIGAVWGHSLAWEGLPPYQTGGSMVQKVTFQASTFKKVPDMYEAGTPNIVGVLGLNESINFLKSLDFQMVKLHEKALLEEATKALEEIPGLIIFGKALEKVSLLSFIIKGIHPHDVAQVLAQANIASRAGHHCAQPLTHLLGVEATSRVSFSIYNTLEEVGYLAQALKKAHRLFI